VYVQITRVLWFSIVCLKNLEYMKYMNERDHNKENGLSLHTFYQSLFQKKKGLIYIS
jgi:hypothetical protein